ncbi:MAG TPA: 2-amino-4-hydroxy-6-hydroxymethyldihydropteridine diphosphokinase [Porticoccaceae bacterium]|nr:2-amino-4-hydroxy-6-hydroxymethyldihydropteridine diphosphokinase [Porticoccaceae bacterium]
MCKNPVQRVYLSIGSNIDRTEKIAAALDALHAEFGRLSISRVYESESVGFDGENFYNLVVGIDCDRPVGELAALMRRIEDNNGRQRDGVRFGPRTLDIDLLTYGQAVGEIDGVSLPRDEILKNAFVLTPLVDIADEELHPVCKRAYRDLSRELPMDGQKLWPVAFIWRGKAISTP